MNLVELAQRIKGLRLDRRLTLEEVASRAGLTRSWLSKVENFRVTPSLSALAQIAAALGVTVAELVEGLDRKPQIALIRRDERRVVERDRDMSNIVYESLAHKFTDRSMDPFLLTVPSGVARKEALPHEGEDFVIVIKGKVALEYGEELFHLEEGDCAYFDGQTAHRLINPNAEPAQVLCVFSGET
jgi:transcriptional regulator with XRE-family HTH domain